MIPNWHAVLSGKVDQERSRDKQCLGTCTPSRSYKSAQQRNSGTEFFVQSLEVMTESERSISFIRRYVGTGQGGNGLSLL